MNLKHRKWPPYSLQKMFEALKNMSLLLSQDVFLEKGIIFGVN